MKLNPVFKNELRLGARSMRNSWIIFFMNLILTTVAGIVFFTNMMEASVVGSIDYGEMVGLYNQLALIEYLIMILIVPSITASSISGERERQTLEVLLTTKMRPWEIIWGKLQASLALVMMLAISSLPVLTLTTIYGGVGLWDLFMLIINMVLSAVFVGSIGIFYSSLVKKTTSATVLTYATIIVVCLGTYAVVYGAYYIQLRYSHLEFFRQGKTLAESAYVLLLNPVSSFIEMMLRQIGTGIGIMNIFKQFNEYRSTMVIRHWIALSGALQMLLAALLLFIASGKINPLKRR